MRLMKDCRHKHRVLWWSGAYTFLKSNPYAKEYKCLCFVEKTELSCGWNKNVMLKKAVYVGWKSRMANTFLAISSICLILNSKFAQKSVHRCTIFCAFQIHAIFFSQRFKIYQYNQNTFYSLLTQLFIQLRKYLKYWKKTLSRIFHQR